MANGPDGNHPGNWKLSRPIWTGYSTAAVARVQFDHAEWAPATDLTETERSGSPARSARTVRRGRGGGSRGQRAHNLGERRDGKRPGGAPAAGTARSEVSVNSLPGEPIPDAIEGRIDKGAGTASQSQPAAPEVQAGRLGKKHEAAVKAPRLKPDPGEQDRKRGAGDLFRLQSSRGLFRGCSRSASGLHRAPTGRKAVLEVVAQSRTINRRSLTWIEKCGGDTPVWASSRGAQHRARREGGGVVVLDFEMKRLGCRVRIRCGGPVGQRDSTGDQAGDVAARLAEQVTTSGRRRAFANPGRVSSMSVSVMSHLFIHDRRGAAGPHHPSHLQVTRAHAFEGVAQTMIATSACRWPARSRSWA